MESIIDNISKNVPIPENEYIAADGLLHCAVCHEKTQTRVSFLGIEKTVRCICKCGQQELNRHAEKEKQEEIDRQKKICFAETNMSNWNFANDDRKNEKLSNAMLKYADNFKEFKANGKGLLLYGTVGTGKTYYAACIANKIIDNGYTALMTNFAKLANKLQGMFDGKQEYIDSLNRYSLLIIDDLGAERQSEYMQEIVFNIVDARYRSGLPFIITTNLSSKELKNPQNVGYARIYDRVLEKCFPVEVTGSSRRQQNVKDTYYDVKEKLGL